MFGLFRKKKKKEAAKPEVKPVEVQEEVVEEEPVVEETTVEEPVVEETTVEPEEVVEEEPAEEPTEEAPAPKKKRKPIAHITKRKADGVWQLKKEGSNRAIKLFETQKEAIEYAKDYEKRTGTAYIIHKEDGSVRKKTY